MSAYSVDVGADSFKEVVLEGSKKTPVIIDFWAPWCAPCRALKPVLEKLADEYGGRFVLAKINSDENQEIAASLGVRSIPAVKAIVNGKLADEFVGALPESQVKAFIDRLLPSPSDLMCKEAGDLIAAGRNDDALALLDQALSVNPKNEAARVGKVEALLALNRVDEARAEFAVLNTVHIDDNRVSVLKARLAFAGQPSEDPVQLEARIAANPKDLDARLRLARHYVQKQAYEPALEHLMEIVRTERKFGDDAGRKTMIEVFNLLGGQGDVVSKYRRLLASALY